MCRISRSFPGNPRFGMRFKGETDWPILSDEQAGDGAVRRVAFFAVLALLVVRPLAAQAACSGDACAFVKVSADGCQWSNTGTKAVRLSLSSFVTVLAPGDAFKQADKGKCVAGGNFEATFPVLRTMPDETVSMARPRPKPTAVAIDTAQAVAPVPAATATAAATVATAASPSGVVVPRAKPAPVLAPVASAPPMPKTKPVEMIATPAEVSTPKAVAASLSNPPCIEGEKTCPPILFKVIDSCIWVLNLNPRAVAFEALVEGKAMALALEGADGDKADAKTGTGIGAHMRLHDPFQSAGSGIPIYRARLGGTGECVKARADISQFTARYVQ